MFARCLIIIILLFSLSTKAQYYNLGQNPSSTKWRQIKTDDFQLIFPNDFQEKAQELANLLVYANEKSRLTLNTKPRKISIILQNNTTVDNGFVTLAPKRSEFYATPSQENDGVDWLKKLAVHEYRHVIQFEKFEDGVGKALKLVFGEQGMGALILLTTPLWMIEGDAVGVETEHTERGRGEYGPFLREFEAQIMELDSLSYEKASFGSFKDYITDYYKLGYFLSEFVKNEYGTHVWDSVMHRLVRNPFPPYPFSYHLKKITGKSTSQLYGDLVFATQKKLKSKQGFYETTSKEILTPESKDFVSYENPVVINDSLFIACKKSYNHPLKFVAVSYGKERVVHTPGNYDDNSLNRHNSTLIWAEKRRHPRWQYLDYSEIILFDIQKKKRKRLRSKTRWFAPTFSPAGDKIAVIEYAKNNVPSLVVLSIKGKEIQRFSFAEGQVFHPNWYTKDSIVISRLNGDENYLEILKLSDSTSIRSKSFSIPLSYPTKYKNGFLVQTLNSNKDCIAFFQFKNRGELREVVNPEFGLKFFSLDYLQENVVYSDYHSKGFKVVKSEIEIGNKIPSDWSRILKDLAVPKRQFEVSKFRPILHLFNFHSWAPFSVNPNDETANLGASIFSQNLLGSSNLSLNYDYFGYTKSQKISARYDFEHFYPKFSVQAYQFIQPKTTIQSVLADVQSVVYQAESEIELYFNGSKFRKSAFLKGAYVYDKSKYDFEEGYIDTVLTFENTQWIAAFGIVHKNGRRDIYSPWSFVLSSACYFNLNENQNAQVLNIYSTIPGILKNDGFKFLLGKQWGTDVFVPDYLGEPRGVLNQSYSRGEKFTAQYAIPLFYPDWKISRLAYVQRVRLDLFYDYLQVNDDLDNGYFSSQGGTLYLDFNPFRYSYLSTFGVQLGFDRNGNLFFAPSFYFSY
ncbi:MAG: hypothetical protein CMP67_02995 [Flavobacteriales bacterium]|nr:hypothetical protein [Flavobacteriales bacterium]|tara:strand:- start:2250 stop:4976 length:2727 start_codon:yes stop_codon:yes gene_type:complete